MTRTRTSLHNASLLFSIKGYRIPCSNNPTSVTIATVSSQPPHKQDAPRVPLVEHRFQWWPIPQAYIHDCDVLYRGTRFRFFFQRHKVLPRNSTLSIQGELIVMRVGKNTQNVVNLRSGDPRSIRCAARRFAPHLAWFQERCGRRFKKVIKL
ncbi:hypothetical protein F5051DRAFT_413928 [Lentinula edodes]|nr:hypothetical protein F5051DRAFT_413928 [Lentinula edodes]